MAVLLPNCALSVLVQPHPLARDAHGTPIGMPAGSVLTTRGPYPGSAVAGGTNLTGILTEPEQWAMRLDTRMSPLRPGDKVTDGARVWTILSAHDNVLPGYPAADYIDATAQLEPLDVQ